MEVSPRLLDELPVPFRFTTSLAIGLLPGLERQRNPTAKAGLRTCVLVALFGTVCALIAQTTASAWIVAAGWLLTGAMTIAAYAGNAQLAWRCAPAFVTTTAGLLLAMAFV